MSWFVMLNGVYNMPTPLVNENDDLELYETREEAKIKAEQNLLGEVRCYEIYKWDF